MMIVVLVRPRILLWWCGGGVVVVVILVMVILVGSVVVRLEDEGNAIKDLVKERRVHGGVGWVVRVHFVTQGSRGPGRPGGSSGVGNKDVLDSAMLRQMLR